MHVAEPLFELQHLLADDREAEVPGLDDAGMDGPDGNLGHAVAGHAHEFVSIGLRRHGGGEVARMWRERHVVRRPGRVS